MDNNGYAPMFGTPPFFSPWDVGGYGGGYGGDYGSMSGWGAPAPAGVPTVTAPTISSASTVPTVGAPQVGPVGTRLGFNMPTANLALSGLSTIGNLWAAFQAQKLAREQFRFTKGVTTTNLNNQTDTYNTAIRDRAFSRAKTEGRDAASAQAYIDANSLKRFGT